MHIDRTHEIAVATKPAATADPSSSLGFVLMLASGTPATASSFGAGRARDARLFAFVHEVIKVLAVFPLRHAAMVVTATIAGTHAVRIADEERADVVSDAEVDDFAGGLMPQVTDATRGPAAHLVLGPGEFFPAPRACSACGISTQTCSAKPLFQTSVHAPALSGRVSGRTRDWWPLPIGNTTRPFSRWTAWALRANWPLVACCKSMTSGHRVWVRRAALWVSMPRFQTRAASCCAALRRCKSVGERPVRR
jgi:hypothetical protein